MTKLEIFQRIATQHNLISQVFVSGDNAVLIGEVIKDMRQMVKELEADIAAEAKREAELGRAAPSEKEHAQADNAPEEDK